MAQLDVRSATIERLTQWLGWGLAAGLAAAHLYFLVKFKIDLPIADEWSDFAPRRGMSRELTWQWLFATTNSHPLVGQRLLSWLFLVADGRDYKTQALVQFLVLVPAVFWLLKHCQRELAVPLGWLAALMFTALHAANYYWPFMFFLYLHFVGTFIAVYLITSQRPGAMLLGYAIAAASTLQAGPGIATGAAIATVGPMLGLRLRSHAWIHGVGFALIATTLALWFALAHRDNPFVLENAPWSPQYWGFVSLALASTTGIGFPRIDPQWLGWACAFGALLLVVGCLLAARLWFSRGGLRLAESRLARFASMWFLVAISSLLLIALSRPWQTGFLVLRYHVVSLPVILAMLLMAIGHSRTNGTKRAWQELVPAAAALAALAWSVPNMNLKWHYERHGTQAVAQLECARSFFAGERAESCDEGPYTWGIEQGHIRTARSVGASFCRSVAPSVSRYADLESCYESIDRSLPSP